MSLLQFASVVAFNIAKPKPERDRTLFHVRADILTHLHAWARGGSFGLFMVGIRNDYERARFQVSRARAE